MRVILVFVFSQAYCMAFIFRMNSRKLTVSFSGIAKESGKTFAVMQVGAIILSIGLKRWIANKRAVEEALDYMISQMEYLRRELLMISNEIRKMMREERYKTNYYLLRTITGIGPLTAASILVEIGDVKRFETFYHLNSFVGCS